MDAHVLVAEDDATARLMLSEMLRYRGYRVTQVPDGESALDALEHETFDVVLADIVMGNVDGIEVLHTARLQPYRPAVILLTGHGTLETCMAALRAGAIDYLIKPCADETLLACVERAWQRSRDEQRLIEAAELINSIYRPEPVESSRQQPADPHAPTSSGTPRAAATLRIGALELGNTRTDVTFNRQPIRLTPIEYALLRCLGDTPGTVRTFSEIVRHTHELNVNDAEAQALLKVHVSNVRKKLSPAYLINDRGIGYMLVEPEGR